MADGILDGVIGGGENIGPGAGWILACFALGRMVTGGGTSSARARPLATAATASSSGTRGLKRGGRKSVGPWVTTYLVLYNVLSALAWGYFGYAFIRSFLSMGVHNLGLTARATVPTLAYVQTGAVLEVLHVLLGWVPSQLLSTTVQIASRLFVVWLPAYWMQLGSEVPLGYALIAVAWTLSDLTRYIYYVGSLLGRTPYVLTWLRYTLFLGLYPMGTLGEMYLIARASAVFGEMRLWYRWVLLGLLAIYPFGFLFMYAHMRKQRAKYLSRTSRP